MNRSLVGKTLWLSSAAALADPLRELREEYLKAIGREEDEKLSSWLGIPELISDDLEDCEKGVPNTKFGFDGIGQLYIQDTTTGEITRFDGVKNITPIDPIMEIKLFKEEMKMADKTRFDMYKPKISKVIFNEPATIVFWTDGTKTIVKCGENDDFDPEKGIAMCCMKKLLGTNKTGSNYLDGVKNYISKWEEDNIVESIWTKLFFELGKMTGGDLVNTEAMDIPPEVTVEKEFEAVTSDDWTAVPADENQVAEENGE